MKKKIAVFAGSFDPFTKGHLDIVDRSLNFCDELVIAIGINSQQENLILLKMKELPISEKLH